MGLLPEQFWDFTLHEFLLYKRGFEDMLKHKERNEWERTRYLATVILQPHTKQGKTIKPTDLFKFEDERSKENITLEERKKRAKYASKKLDAIEKQKNKKPKKKLF